MYAPVPQKITSNLLKEANDLALKWPPDEMSVQRLKRKAEALRSVSAADYDMVLGICSTLLLDKPEADNYFRSAMKKDPGGSDIVDNYILSLGMLTHHDSAAEVARDKMPRFAGDAEYLSKAIHAFMAAGRFHEAAKTLEDLRSLGVAAAGHLKDDVVAETLSQALEGVSDEDVAAVIRFSDAFVRDRSLKVGTLGFQPLGPEQNGLDRDGLEYMYVFEHGVKDAAELDFQLSVALADAGFPIVDTGLLFVSISSFVEDDDGDIAA